MDPLQPIGPIDSRFPAVGAAPPLRRVARDQPSQAQDDERSRQRSAERQAYDESQEEDDDRPGPHIDITA